GCRRDGSTVGAHRSQSLGPAVNCFPGQHHPGELFVHEGTGHVIPAETKPTNPLADTCRLVRYCLLRLGCSLVCLAGWLERANRPQRRRACITAASVGRPFLVGCYRRGLSAPWRVPIFWGNHPSAQGSTNDFLAGIGGGAAGQSSLSPRGSRKPLRRKR